MRLHIPFPALVAFSCVANLAAAGDSRADRIVEKTDAKVQAERAERFQKSIEKHTTEPHAASPETRSGLLGEIKDLSKLSLEDTLRIATRYNRDFANERDSNRQAGLSYVQTRHQYDPRLSGAIGVLAGHTDDTRSVSTNGNLSMDLATELSTRLRLDFDTHNIGQQPVGNSNNSNATITVTQPLLRGAGRLVAREPLTLAERAMTDRLRAFELFRQDFSIDVISRFYNLVKETRFVSNSKQRFDQADFLYRRAKALFKIGRQSELDVLSAEQERLQAENDYSEAEESHKDSLLAFKTFMGLPDDLVVDVRTDELPALERIKMNPDQAVRLAVENRLDLASLEDQIFDAERGVKIAHNALLPDLNLQLSGGTGARGTQFKNQTINDHVATAGLTMQLPLDRLEQKVSYERSQLSLDRAKRGASVFRDNLSAEIRRLLRNLTRIEQSMEIQKRILTTSEKRLANAETLFRKGQRNSRDVVDAEQALLKARNDDIQFVIDHAIASLQLQRALGLLDVAPDGIPVKRDLSVLARDKDAVPQVENNKQPNSKEQPK